MAETPTHINLREYESLTCADCGGEHFVLVTIIKHIPRLAVGAAKDMYPEVNVYKCDNCGQILDKLNPLTEDGPETKPLKVVPNSKETKKDLLN